MIKANLRLSQFIFDLASLSNHIFHFRAPPRNLDQRTSITIGDQTFVIDADSLERISELGRGAYGIVEQMRHVPSGTIMAVKVRRHRPVGACLGVGGPSSNQLTFLKDMMPTFP